MYLLIEEGDKKRDLLRGGEMGCCGAEHRNCAYNTECKQYECCDKDSSIVRMRRNEPMGLATNTYSVPDFCNSVKGLALFGKKAATCPSLAVIPCFWRTGEGTVDLEIHNYPAIVGENRR